MRSGKTYGTIRQIILGKGHLRRQTHLPIAPNSSSKNKNVLIQAEFTQKEERL